MKKIIVFILSSFFCINAFSQQQSNDHQQYAVDGYYEHGLYVGGQIGYPFAHDSHADFNAADILLPIYGGTGQRIYAGYQINDNAAIEAGYNWLIDYEDTGGSLDKKDYTKMTSFDVMGKGMIPLNLQFSAFLKAGLARVRQDIQESTHHGLNVSYKNNQTKLTLIAVPGITYHYSKHVSIDASWTHMLDHDDFNGFDILGMGISYTF